MFQKNISFLSYNRLNVIRMIDMNDINLIQIECYENYNMIDMKVDTEDMDACCVLFVMSLVWEKYNFPPDRI